MKRMPKMYIDNEAIAAIVREAVNDGHMSLSEIASLAGLSVTTPARIYHGTKNQVQTKTARRIASALGYEVHTSAHGQVRFEKLDERSERSKLTGAQKDRILKAVERTLREELDRL